MTTRTIEDIRSVSDMRPGEIVYGTPGVLYGIRDFEQQVVPDGGVALIYRRGRKICAKDTGGSWYCIAEEAGDPHFILTSRFAAKENRR
jgi:hypothetical protein